MNFIELERSLRQLRLRRYGRHARNPSRHARTEAMASIDLISCLISDELTPRADRLLERRRKQGGVG